MVTQKADTPLPVSPPKKVRTQLATPFERDGAADPAGFLLYRSSDDEATDEGFTTDEQETSQAPERGGIPFSQSDFIGEVPDSAECKRRLKKESIKSQSVLQVLRMPQTRNNQDRIDRVDTLRGAASGQDAKGSQNSMTYTPRGSFRGGAKKTVRNLKKSGPARRSALAKHSC
eukprot:CAMPEP_0170510086 /NCGR_PEP_ID=MMETSP0208-20121228/65573_1 /TAXON_ID=197538 /ORGANISM="Strombidium inclinatum, Strain S3" /LENGTH=172 /DNA_ID=CAMNT_0010793513 /DNA_START=729 /DNA_END=1247 /DNA_ORIENTATION=-